MRFALVIQKDPDSDYGVIVLDLPGCFSAGETIDEAMEQAREAIECHLEAMLQEGEAIPTLRPIEQHRTNPEYAGGIFAFVDVDINKLAGVSERINITIPKLILRKIDAYAKKASLARSTFIANAALEYIKNLQRK
jgi:predicted RNase H-like HicB family nuclease